MHFSQVRKMLVAELAPPHAQSAWGLRGERVWVSGLAVYCNYLSKKENWYKYPKMNLLMSHKIVAYTRLTESMLYAKSLTRGTNLKH